MAKKSNPYSPYKKKEDYIEALKEDISLKEVYRLMKEKGLSKMLDSHDISLSNNMRDKRFQGMWRTTGKQIFGLIDKREKILMNYLKRNKDKKYMGINK
ncbi:hypothetical protein LCGC14_0838290 [marine sediment metagenome]|uniref:Uncharacterized protein n=1 Tax=marine sediment metagenome TaxID=412755 RepID=A0A0F9PZ50_9ZZZZ